MAKGRLLYLYGQFLSWQAAQPSSLQLSDSQVRESLVEAKVLTEDFEGSSRKAANGGRWRMRFSRG